MDDVKSKLTFGACPHDCPDTCAMVYEIEDNKLISVKGNKDHPMTRGTLCVKVKDYEQRHYHPDRIQYPMKRVGEAEDLAGLITFLSSEKANYMTGLAVQVDGGSARTFY